MQQWCRLLYFRCAILNTAANVLRVSGSSGRSAPTRVLCCISRRRRATAEASQCVRFHDSRMIYMIAKAFVQARHPSADRRAAAGSRRSWPLSSRCRLATLPNLAAFRKTHAYGIAHHIERCIYGFKRRRQAQARNTSKAAFTRGDWVGASAFTVTVRQGPVCVANCATTRRDAIRNDATRPRAHAAMRLTH
jgi:hypothetical protein